MSLLASDPPSQPNMLDRIMNPDRSQKSAYQGKAFDPSGGTFDKAMKTREYPGVREFTSKSFLSKTFDGAKKSWLGGLFFHEKKLPENFSGVNREGSKTFASKDIPLKSYGDPDKRSGFSTKEKFDTRQITPRGSSQGAIDADQQLQQAIKKGLSVEDVRKLLNKAP